MNYSVKHGAYRLRVDLEIGYRRTSRIVTVYTLRDLFNVLYYPRAHVEVLLLPENDPCRLWVKVKSIEPQ